MFAKLLKIKMIEKDQKAIDIAKQIGTTRQNFSQKLNKDNFKESDMVRIADAIGCDLKIELVPRNE